LLVVIAIIAILASLRSTLSPRERAGVRGNGTKYAIRVSQSRDVELVVEK